MEALTHRRIDAIVPTTPAFGDKTVAALGIPGRSSAAVEAGQ